MIQRKNSGFTIIEIIIVITIMAILTSVVVISLRTSQENAKATERRDDASAIARVLEKYYKDAEGTQTYPISSNLAGVINSAVANSDIEVASLKSPDDTSASPPLYSLQTTGTLATQPPSEKYIYLPLRGDSISTLTVCSTEPCRRFFLYYKDAEGIMTKIESLNK